MTTPELGKPSPLWKRPARWGQVANRLGQPINRQGFTIIPYLDPLPLTGWISIRRV